MKPKVGEAFSITLETTIEPSTPAFSAIWRIGASKVMENASPTFGFNAQTEEYVDLVQAGVIDPAKVVRTALQDAASVAGLMITTEAAIVEAPKKGGGGGMPGGGMGGMGDMDF